MTRIILGSLELQDRLIARRADSRLLETAVAATLTSESEKFIRVTAATDIDVNLPVSGVFAGWSVIVLSSDTSVGQVYIKVAGATVATVDAGRTAEIIALSDTPTTSSLWVAAESGITISDITVSDGLYNSGAALGVRLAGVDGGGVGTPSNDRTLDIISNSLETRLSTDSGLDKFSDAVNGGLRIQRVYTKIHGATTDWSGPSGGYYSMYISAAVHLQGLTPEVNCYELVTSNYDHIYPDRITVDALGNVTIYVPDTPDLRYSGKVVVQQAR